MTTATPFTDAEKSANLTLGEDGRHRHADGSLATDREAAFHIWGEPKTYSTGIIILGTDERRAVVKRRPVRLSLTGELPPDYKHTDYIEAHFEERRLTNASALCIGVGRWGVWFYWRRRPNFEGLNGRWLIFRDVQAEHAASEVTA